MKGVFGVGVFIKIDFIYEIPFKLYIYYIHESIFVCGVVDRNHKGSIGVLMHNSTPEDFIINRNDRIAQLIVEKIVEATGVVVGNITEGQSIDRGAKRFGSSGVKFQFYDPNMIKSIYHLSVVFHFSPVWCEKLNNS